MRYIEVLLHLKKDLIVLYSAFADYYGDLLIEFFFFFNENFYGKTSIHCFLSVKDSSSAVDMHPEKRVKAAYAAFEEIRLPVLKKENPNMRLSQLKQILKKEWQKSPDNPLNQRHRVLNS